MANGLENDVVGTTMARSDEADRDLKAMLAVSQLDQATQFDILKKWWKADADHSREWRQQARDDFAFRAGEQWTPEDKALLDSRQRPHIVFNRVLAILKAVAGMEINGRHEISFVPRNTADTAVNELLTSASKWMSDECDAEDEESQSFDDTATCGMGWVECRMSYEDEPQGLYIEEQVNPLETYWDRTARKKNLSDARRMSRVRRMPISDAIALFPNKTRAQLDAVWADEALGDYPTRTLEDRRRRDSDNSGIHNYDDTSEVTIVNMQWIEKEPFWLVANLQTNEKVPLTDEEYKQFSVRMKTLAQAVPPDMAWQFEVHAVRMTRKIYKSAFLGGELLQAAIDAPIKGQFSWACITGERDVNKGTWFGLVRVMRDPQMWANKWLSQILHILNSTAKGGILAEEGAFEDQREAENSYAQSDTITYVANGSLSGQKPKIMPKPGAGITDGIVGLMTFAISSMKDVTGINLELLGQQDQNQPGIIEAMRKQAGMTVLATLFDSLRRFRKLVGRKRLFFIQNYLADGRIIRVSTDDDVQALPLLRDQCLGEYNVVVDDTPTSPNQKEANWAIIQPLLAVFKDQLIANPQVFAMLLEYSPLPNRIVQAIKNFIAQQGQDPDAQVDKNLSRQLTVSEINKNQSTAEMQNAKAGATQQTALYDLAMAQHMLNSGRFDDLKEHLSAMETAAKAKTAMATADKAQADADHSRAKTAREMVGTHLDIAQANGDQVGALIDHLSATAGAHRQMAAAHKDHIAAIKNAMTPVQRQSAMPMMQ
jgi:hypothetical protein